jgi:hypothetical protein
MRTKLKPDVLQADRLAREFVLERDGYQCFFCHRTPWTTNYLEWAHIITRGARHLRWDPDNAVILCHGDHAYFTDHPREWRRFVAEKFGSAHWDGLKRRQAEAEKRGDKVDVAAVIAFYRERLTPKEADAYRNGEW